MVGLTCIWAVLCKDCRITLWSGKGGDGFREGKVMVYIEYLEDSCYPRTRCFSEGYYYYYLFFLGT